MATPALSVVCWVFALFATIFAALSFGRGIAHIWQQVSSGTPLPGRGRPVIRRLWSTLTTILSHREFTGRPIVKAAHWLVMMSFPLLFFTLVTGYAQLRDQSWSLPLIGHFPPWEWVTEFFAWSGLLGIITLMFIRFRAGSGSAAEAALSNENPDAALTQSGDSALSPAEAMHRDTHEIPESPEIPSSVVPSPQPRDGSPRGLASRFLGSTRWQALFVEWVVLIVCACVLGLRALEFALYTTLPDFTHYASVLHFPMTSWIGNILLTVTGAAGATDTTLIFANAIVIVSAVKIFTSMVWLMVVGVQTSMGVAWHRFVAVVNLYARRNPRGEKSLGPAKPLFIDGQPVTSPDAFDDITDEASLGVARIEDFSWKARLDLYSCTECGRCQELCPAWNTQKPLSPKLMVLALRDHMESVSNKEMVIEEVTDAQVPGEGGVASLEVDGKMLLDKGTEPIPHSFDVLTTLSLSGATGPQGVADLPAPLVPDVISEEALWDCTMCGACVEQCPVDIEHIDHILDIRRHQTLMESAFPRDLARPFRGMESKGTPYNQPARKRMDWAKNLDFDIPVVGEDLETAEDVDYLFWVGCAGAYDDKAKHTSAAVAELLHTAGVSFAVLGSQESCTGDPARRAGNEILFQMLAAQAIDTLHEARAQTIVVSCAHCFNTIAGEYPELGGHFDVVHHTQLLNRLVREGKLTPVAPPSDLHRADEDADSTARTLQVTYHDACFLGRHNKIYEPPRELVSSLPGVELVEMPRNRDRAMCCGAGGAHAWFEESRGLRIADARMTEATSTGADVIATACPFCTQMLGSASSTGLALSNDAESGSGTQPEVRDVAVMLLESVRRGRQ